MKLAFQMVVTTKRLSPVLRRAQYTVSLSRQSTYRGVWRDAASTRRLVSNRPNCAPGDTRHHAKQVPRLRVPVERFRNFADASRQAGSGFGQHSCDLGESPPSRGCDRLRHHWQQLAGGHSNQGQEVFSGFFFALRLRSQFAQMLHHSVWIDLADGADLVLELVLELVFTFEFVFAFSEDAPKKVFLLTFPENAAEKVFAFPENAPKEILFFFFQFVFRFVFEFRFEFVFEFGFQLAFVCHDGSSCEK